MYVLTPVNVFDGGYDIAGNVDGVLEEFDNIIGLEKLCAIHLNDSKNTLDSHRDRHECIGKGYIGLDALSKIYHHSALSKLPFILETPNDLVGYVAEISFLKSSSTKIKPANVGLNIVRRSLYMQNYGHTKMVCP